MSASPGAPSPVDSGIVDGRAAACAPCPVAATSCPCAAGAALVGVAGCSGGAAGAGGVAVAARAGVDGEAAGVGRRSSARSGGTTDGCGAGGAAAAAAPQAAVTHTSSAISTFALAMPLHHHPRVGDHVTGCVERLLVPARRPQVNDVAPGGHAGVQHGAA